MNAVMISVDALRGQGWETAVRQSHAARPHTTPRPEREPAPRVHTTAIVRELARRVDNHVFDPTW
jgi:hypothetical protein